MSLPVKRAEGIVRPERGSRIGCAAERGADGAARRPCRNCQAAEKKRANRLQSNKNSGKVIQQAEE